MYVGKPRDLSFAGRAGRLLVLASLLAGCAPALQPTISASPSLSASPVPTVSPSSLASLAPSALISPAPSASALLSASPTPGPPNLLPAYFEVWEPSSATALKDDGGVVLKD